MTEKILFFKLQFISAAFFISIPGVCLAEPGNNAKVNEQEMFLDDDELTAELTGQLTAAQQSESKPSRDITQKIREAIESDKSLSSDAHNVKIIMVDKTVTLKGSVRTEKEKKTIEEKAYRIAGNGNIKSEIGIAP